VASTGFISYSHMLDDSQPWYFNGSPYLTGPGAVLATNAQIQAVLSDLQYIGISTDIDDVDVTYTDNVKAVPEPVSLVALSLVLATVARKRRKS
nr:PEP-CTERM sorting domain-containing protein [Fimbriimonadaceae bacterium]